MVVVQSQGRGVHGPVEGPGVGGVLLGQHLLQQVAAVPQLGAQLALPRRLRLHRIGQVLLGGLDGPSAAHPSAGAGHHGLQQDGPRGAPDQAHPRRGLQAHRSHGRDGVYGGVVDLAPEGSVASVAPKRPVAPEGSMAPVASVATVASMTSMTTVATVATVASFPQAHHVSGS